jgi:thiosulfate/3-mercaptopyruvate sulfurtransferase
VIKPIRDGIAATFAASLAFALSVWLAVLPAPALAQASTNPATTRLVTPAWLEQNRAQVLLLDASSTPQHMKAHIPGAVSADLYRYGPREAPRAAMQQRLQSWGVSPARKIVVYDQGGDMMAPRLFYDLYYYGVPAQDLYLLDGGMAAWRAHGGAVTAEPTPPPPAGTWRIDAVREEVRSRLPEFMTASADRSKHALVEALEPTYHYGAQKYFDRAGHVPNAVSMPWQDFFNADKTFRSADEMKRVLRYHRIGAQQVVHSHCGGGVAAAVPWFAFQFLAGHPQTKLYLESQREWLRDDRGLPYWTYGAQALRRDSTFVAGWNAPMMRAFGVAALNIVDVRPAAAYAQGHVPYALNIPADVFRAHLGRPEQLPTQLAALLGPAGVNPAHEVVLVSDKALTPDAALTFVALEQAGHKPVSVLMDSVDEWGLRGLELTNKPTRVGAPQGMTDVAVPPAAYPARSAAGVVVADPTATRGEFDKVFIASGAAAPAAGRGAPQGSRVVHLPFAAMLNPDGAPKPAKDLWAMIDKAGVPRHAELIVFADDVAEAAVNYFVFRLMGWPDVKLWARD